MYVKLRLAKFQLSGARNTFSNWGLNEEMRNSIKNRTYLENGERYGQDYY